MVKLHKASLPKVEKAELPELPEIRVTVDVSVCSTYHGGGYDVYLEVKDKEHHPVAMWTLPSIPSVQNWIARGREPWNWALASHGYPAEVLEYVPETLKQNAVLVWNDKDVKVTPEFSKHLEVYHKTYSGEELQAMTIKELQLIAYAKKAPHRGKKPDLIENILRVQKPVNMKGNCKRATFGDFYNCAWAHRKECPEELQEVCKERAQGQP